MKKSAIVLIILAFVIAGLVLGFLLWPKTANHTVPVDNNRPTDSQPIIDNDDSEPTAITTEPEIITSEIDTSEWKTYRNEEYGFEFKYPAELELSVDKSFDYYNITEQFATMGRVTLNYKTAIDSDGSIGIKVRSNQDGLPLRDYYKTMAETSEIAMSNYYEIGKPQVMVIDNIESVQFSDIPLPPAPLKGVITAIPLNHIVIEFTLFSEINAFGSESNYSYSKKIYDEILKNIKIKK